MSISNNFISITDIRQNATTYINELKKTGDKIIFRNNKPTAVLVDFHRYEKIIENISNIEDLNGSNEVLGKKRLLNSEKNKIEYWDDIEINNLGKSSLITSNSF